MQIDTNAPAADPTITAPAVPAATTQQPSTPPAGAATADAGQTQPSDGTTSTTPAEGKPGDQGTQQGQQAQKDGTAAENEQDRDEAGRFKSKIQKRIDELTHARHAAEREAARWRSIAEGGQKANPAPQAHEFATDEDYNAALQQHQITEAARKVAADQAKQAAEQYQQDATHAADATYDQRAQEAARRIPDFTDVVGKADIQITHDMLAALKSSAHGPDLVYALAKDPAQAARIAAMPTAQMYMALGAMEATVASKAVTAPAPAAAAAPAARTTNAPAPASTGAPAGAAPANNDPSKMSQGEYEAWRKANGAKYFR